jgi:hypothetical protein
MSIKKGIVRYLRGWLPKDPVMPENRLKNIRKPVAVFLTVTMLVASVSLIYFYATVTKPIPPNLPEPLPTQPPTSAQPSTSPLPTHFETPTPATQPTTPTSSSTSPPLTQMPAPDHPAIPSPTLTPIASSEDLIDVVNTLVAPTLEYNYWKYGIYYPKIADSLFLVVQFRFNAVALQFNFSVSDVTVAVDGQTQYSPCGYDHSSSVTGLLYNIGSFSGVISSNRIDYYIDESKTLMGATILPYVDIFAYELPQTALTGSHLYELTVPGFPSEMFTITVPIPTPAPTPTPTPAPTPEPVVEKWSRSFGEAGNETAYALIQTGDGGFAVAGCTDSFGAGAEDMFLVNTDLNGNQQWNKTYGGTGSEKAYSLLATSDGGYALAGYTTSFGKGNSDMWLVKTDRNGVMQWSKTYGGTGTEVACSMVNAHDGGYILAGSTTCLSAGYSDVFLVKTDATGNMQWNQTIGTAGSDESAYQVIQTIDGGYAVVGKMGFRVLLFDSQGNIKEQQPISDLNPEFSIAQSSDGTFTMLSYSYSVGPGNPPSYVSSVTTADRNGNYQANRHYLDFRTYSPSVPSWPDRQFLAIKTNDDGYAFTASLSTSNNHRMMLLRVDSNRNQVWGISYGQANCDFGNSIIQTADGSYIIAGCTNTGSGISDMWLVKIGLR